jgi:[acyl-carrier-protein] S-malonyltransferase
VSAPSLLFPGQGSQRVGMGADLCREFAVAREVFSEADQALGEPLSQLCFAGPEDALTLTENAQPALLATAIAVARVLQAEGGIVPDVAAGHSLGEWSALVCMDALSLDDALRAVRARGRYMQEAIAPGVGAMAALLGADLPTVRVLCDEASSADEIVVPANVNGAGQIVVSGHVAAVERLEGRAAKQRVRAMRLKVSAPFHSPLMAPARERMAVLLRDLAVRAPRGVVLGNVDGEPYPAGNAEAVRARLSAQITSTVLWEACARAVAARTDAGIEAGPGKVLCGLFRRIEPEFRCLPTDDVAGVRAVLAAVRA